MTVSASTASFANSITPKGRADIHRNGCFEGTAGDVQIGQHFLHTVVPEDLFKRADGRAVEHLRECLPFEHILDGRRG